jgi:hypothetical protein
MQKPGAEVSRNLASYSLHIYSLVTRCCPLPLAPTTHTHTHATHTQAGQVEELSAHLRAQQEAQVNALTSIASLKGQLAEAETQAAVSCVWRAWCADLLG